MSFINYFNHRYLSIRNFLKKAPLGAFLSIKINLDTLIRFHFDSVQK